MAFAFEKLLVYQKAIDFADKICGLTNSFPKGYYFLTDQLNRASLSIAANIAEGNGRFTKADRKNFFGIAREFGARVCSAAGTCSSPSAARPRTAPSVQSGTGGYLQDDQRPNQRPRKAADMNSRSTRTSQVCGAGNQSPCRWQMTSVMDVNAYLAQHAPIIGFGRTAAPNSVLTAMHPRCTLS